MAYTLLIHLLFVLAPPPGQLALQGSCQPRWEPTFGAPGLNADALAATAFDAGSGPELIVGGGFNRAGGAAAHRLARWDETGWAALGDGLDADSPRGVSPVLALATYDDGSGPALHAGGRFTSAGGASAQRIARWDGSAWSALGSGVSAFQFEPEVRALAVFDDGGGPDLYVGGAFQHASGVPCNHVARWDGTSWSAVGSGMNAAVLSLAVFDDGSGPALYAGGTFSTAGGSAASSIARWDGTSWSAVGGGMDGGVECLQVHDDGGGPALYAGGWFTSAGGAPASRIARWDGSTWTPLGAGLDAGVSALASLDDGSGPVLIAGGTFTLAGGAPASHVARWDGSGWAPLGSGTDRPVRALASYPEGGGEKLCVLGEFTSAGGLPANRVARWDGTWSLYDTGPDNELSGNVLALADLDDGDPSGPGLYAGGVFPTGTALEFLSRWDGTSWTTPGGIGPDGTVFALQPFDDGGGPALFVGGEFDSAGAISASAVARWDGTSWSALGGGVSGSFLGPTAVHALALFDDGGGPALFAGGNFLSAGGSPAPGIARWDGVSWSRLRLGLAGVVQTLAVFDDGGGPALYAGGFFQATGSGAAMNHLARWNGSGWSSVGGGTDAAVFALAVFDDGSGPALYAGGWFTSAGGVPASSIARWDGVAWSAVGGGLGLSWTGGVPSATALTVLDDGSGAALHVGGFFDLAGGLPAAFVARWDGSAWAPLGGGVDNTVRAFLVRDLPEGRALLVGGDFTAAHDSRDAHLARWQGCLDVVGPTIHGPPDLFVRERGGAPGEVVTFHVTASDARDPAPSLVCVPPSGSFFPPGATAVTCTATDAAGNQSVHVFAVRVGARVR